MADQVLTRGVQKIAENILNSPDFEAEQNKNLLPGFSYESGDSEATARRSERNTKSKGPKRYGNPVKYSIKLVSPQQDVTDLNKAALEAYRVKLANFRTDANKPEETKLGLLEKHFFRRKFGIEALDISKTWNASWRVTPNFEDEEFGQLEEK